MAAGKIPKWTWGAGYVNTLNIGYPLDNVKAWSEPEEGSDWARTSSGAEDAWVVDFRQFLAGDYRWIPTADTTDPVATGWDGATGFRAFLEWMLQGNIGRFYPDKDVGTYIESYLEAPRRPEPGLEKDGTRTIRLVVRSKDDSAFTGY